MKRQPRYKEGDLIDGWYLVYQIHMGGMGEVYLCMDQEWIEPVALKTFQGSDLKMRQYFEDEVKNWIALEKHPNIVRCRWMKIIDNIPFMGLEWIEREKSHGVELRDWLRSGSVDVELALRFSIDICRGLDHAHDKVNGIVHRDLKPENILINHSRKAKITDFGLATIVHKAELETEPMEDNEQILAHSHYIGSIVGTPLYMAPEQWRGENESLDYRTDMYAVGCMLYEMLTGEFIYYGQTRTELSHKHISEPIPKYRGELETRINPILEKCLAKKQIERYSDFKQILQDLSELYEQKTGDLPPKIVTNSFTDIDYLNRGLTYVNLGYEQKAIEDYDKALEINLNYAEVYLSRGYAKGRINLPDEAMVDYQKVIELDPTEHRAWCNCAYILIGKGKYQEAIEYLDTALQLDSNDFRSYFNRGSAYEYLKNYVKAFDDFTQAIASVVTEPVVYYRRGLVGIKLGRYQQAVSDFTEAIQHGIEDVDLYWNRGYALNELARYKEAIENFTTGLKIQEKYFQDTIGNILEPEFFPYGPRFFVSRGFSYDKLEMYDKALKDFNMALTFEPENVNALLKRGNVYRNMNKDNDALQDYDKVIKLTQSNDEVYNNRGNLHSDHGRLAEAIDDYTHAINLLPDYTRYYFHRGLAYDKLQLDIKALHDFDKTTSLNPTWDEAHYNKGASLANLGRFQEALVAFQRAGELGSNQGTQSAQQIRQMLGIPDPNAHLNDPQAAFDAFQQTKSLDDMRNTVKNYPILKQMVPTIEKIIQEQVPQILRSLYTQPLDWLKQTIAEGD